MSNILVQNIKHTNNTTAIEINSSAQMTVKGEGSATTNLQQGLCKAWCDYNGNTAAITDNFNIGGITDNGTGDYTFAYTNAMASINYVFLGDAQFEDGTIGSTTMLNPKSGDANNRGASSVRVECKSMSTSSGPSNYDYKQQQFLVQGDLA